MGKTFIFGHKNPDTDSICSAIVYADLKTKLGLDVEAVRLGDINDETAFALQTFNAEAPRFIEKASPEVDSVILVDHNERQQSVDDIDDVHVLEVIDHHRIANFETADPLYYRAEPVGCTTTILNKLYKEHGVEIEKNIAGLMLSAIISDSLLFKSPTCTEQDVKAAQELAEIAGVDANEYGLSMLKAGADLSGKTAEELIGIDAKVFPMGSKKVEIAQINAIDPADVLALKAELEEAVTNAIVEKTLDLFLVVITDILNSDSVAIAIGAETSAVEEAFNVKLESNQALLKGVVSRKKQIVPVLTEILQER
ncbi:manganese-dependent inorganic pyrophosphatase [Domibacillus robiginosus]|uniref:manganese-dependent inorganic pyrophosphatase n=1 Tax=Domibacillus robiginosus TaxID=1071054 RepID=UPI00067AF9DF|nr:manganese-dependent inorganic pyrophosphatase [Domibacillus robiginosus]